MLDWLDTALETIRVFLTQRFPGGELGSTLASWASGELLAAIGFAFLLSGLWALSTLREFLARRKVRKAIAARRDEIPGLIAILVMRPSGFPRLRLGSFAARQQFTILLARTTTKALNVFHPAKSGAFEVFTYPAMTGRLSRSADQAKAARRAQRHLRRAGGDIAVAVQMEDAKSASLQLVPRVGIGDETDTFGLTISDRPELEEALATAAAFFAVNMAGEDVASFADWLSVDRVRYLEQLTPLILDPPDGIAGHDKYREIQTAFAAAGTAAMQRDFLSDGVGRALIAVAEAALKRADAAGRVAATLALGETLLWVGDFDRTEIVLAPLSDAEPQARGLISHIQAERARASGDLEVLESVIAGLAGATQLSVLAARLNCLEAWESSLDGAARAEAIEDGLSVAAICLQSGTGLDLVCVPRNWAGVHLDQARLRGAAAALLPVADERQAVLEGADTDITDARAKLTAAQAPVALRMLLVAQTGLCRTRAGQTKDTAVQNVLNQQRLDLANAQRDLLPSDGFSEFRAAAEFGRGQALRQIGRSQANKARLTNAAEALEYAADLYGETVSAVMAWGAAADVRCQRAKLLIEDAAQESGAIQAERLAVAEEDLNAGLVVLSDCLADPMLASNPQARAVTCQYMSNARASLSGMLRERGRVDEAAGLLELAAIDMARSAALHEGLGDQNWAWQHRAQSEAYAGEAAALRAAEGLAAPETGTPPQGDVVSHGISTKIVIPGDGE